MVIAWNPPQHRRVNKQKRRLIGFSLPRRTWLRDYLIAPGLAFDYAAESLTVRAIDPAAFEKAKDVSLHIDAQRRITIQSSPLHGGVQATSVSSAEVALIVPATLLAYLDALDTGRAQWDPQLRMFVPVAAPPVCDKARLYARTIDDVPAVAAE